MSPHIFMTFHDRLENVWHSVANEHENIVIISGIMQRFHNQILEAHVSTNI